MALVYSDVFVDAPAVSGGPFVAYTAPAGFLTVVKNLSITWGDVVLSDLDAWWVISSGTKLARMQINGGGPFQNTGGGTQQLWGMWALPPGTVLSVQTASGTADFHASGYRLALP